MARTFAHFEPYFTWLNETVDEALTRGDKHALVAAADAFAGAILLPGYSAAAQISWFADKLADPRFAHSRHVHDFGLDIEMDAGALDAASRKRLIDAYLRAVTALQGEADLVLALGFLVRHQSSQESLATIETDLLRLASHERLREYVFDAMRMYALRDDLSPQQQARVRELASAHFG